MTPPAPFAPLVSGGEGLATYPGSQATLAARMAEWWGVRADHVLPVRGVTHGLELVFRLAAREGGRVEAPAGEPFDSLAGLHRLGADAANATVRVIHTVAPDSLRASAAQAAPALLVVDEGSVAFAPHPSAAILISETENLIVLRSLSLEAGLAGARVGAALGSPPALARLRSVMEPHALPTPSVRLAMQAMDPSRLIETEARIARVVAERRRLADRLGAAARETEGPWIELTADAAETSPKLARAGIAAERNGDVLRVTVSDRAEVNDRLLAAVGHASAGRPHRTAEVVRDTHETRIVCAVDLDAPGPVAIRTGVGFFDHMLEQVAAHGGFSLRLSCAGDLHTDAHHTVEDCAIVLGQALRRALGERRGIARYGFVVPMDEARAQVSIDLSGRPYPVFEGDFSTLMIGDYRTDLTAHVVRSLAEHLGAAIHVSVTGDDDHHKTEAVYKALGRALRQAIRVEGGAVPSTKGVL